MIIAPVAPIASLLVPCSSLFHDWNNNCVIQFMNIISQMSNESNCSYFLHHLQSSDTNFGWLGEPVPETSGYQSKLAYSLHKTNSTF